MSVFNTTYDYSTGYGLKFLVLTALYKLRKYTQQLEVKLPQLREATMLSTTRSLPKSFECSFYTHTNIILPEI